MNVEYGWLLIQMRPRVIHRMPGRLRIHIPALKKVNTDFREMASILLNGFRLPQGIENAQINYITGNILVYYSENSYNERLVLDWIFDIKNIFISLFNNFINLNDQEIKNISIKFLEFLKEASKNSTTIDKYFKIPDEIWN